jgi:hypothetical protein
MPWRRRTLVLTALVTAALGLAMASPTGASAAPARAAQPAERSSTSAYTAVVSAPAATLAAKWKKKFVQATICTSGKPFKGKRKNSLACGLGYTTVSGDVKYNGKKVLVQWLDCQHGSSGASNTVTWCGTWNNGGGHGYKYLDLGANGEFKIPQHSHTYWLRIDVHTNGAVKIRGGR